MCRYCKNLGGFQSGNCDTSAVTDMSEMFAESVTIGDIDINSMDTSNVITAANMFKESVITGSVLLGQIDTGRVITMRDMFKEATLRASVFTELNQLDVSSVQDFGYMFFGLVEYTNTYFSIDLDNWDTGSALLMDGMFSSIQELQYITFNNWNTGTVTRMDRMFENSKVLSSVVINWNTDVCTNLNSMFNNCQNLLSCVLGTSFKAVTIGNHMFNNCYKMTTLNMASCTFENLISADSMFKNLASAASSPITITGLGDLSLSKLVTATSMFYSVNLKSHAFHNWRLPALVDASFMFARTGPSPFFLVGLNDWNLPELTTTASMFENSSVTSLDYSKVDVQKLDWFTPKLTNIDNMFRGAYALTTIMVDTVFWDRHPSWATITNYSLAFNGAVEIPNYFGAVTADGIIYSKIPENWKV